MNLDPEVFHSSLNESVLYLEFTENPVIISFLESILSTKPKIKRNVFAGVFKKVFFKKIPNRYYSLNVLRLFVIDFTLVHFT
jgi:hypothetical protein